MDNSIHQHTLIDFWKIPSDSVSFSDGRTGISEKHLLVNMPVYDHQMKPALYRWEKAHLFAPTPGFNPESNDISGAVYVDPTSHTVSLPFNIDQAVLNMLTEQYVRFESYQFFIDLLRQLYYKLKPYLPRKMQVQLRKNVTDLMSRRGFPAWPMDASVDLLHRYLMIKLLEITPGSSLPMISFWPKGAKIALLLTHDVETIAGIANIHKIIDIEQKHGFRSAWNFVPKRYPLDLGILRELQASGFEIGVHGLYHDGKLFDSYTLFQQRADKINETLIQWGSVGFRSESNLRNLEWISKHIRAEYDSSYLSSEWYGAQPGGSCTVFPFIFKNIIELPITLQQDFTLLDILKLTEDEMLAHWMDTVQAIKELNGLVLINVHPDYMTTPERLENYKNFIENMQGETSCWHALPRELARWWGDRNVSELVPSGAGWRIDGPASDRGEVMRVNLREGMLNVQPY